MAGAPSDERNLSDEDLLLARYRRLGDTFLDAARGSFVLALYDPEARLCFAARDGMGNRLASYVLRDDLFVVAVGPERGGAVELLDQPGVSSALDSFRLGEYFAFGEVTGPASFFREVRHLLPGEMIVVEPGSVRRRWLPRPRLDVRFEAASWEEAVAALAELLRASVARALRGHERAAVWLSGGLDSTPIAALAQELLPPVAGRSRVEGISWDVSDAAADDRSFIEAFSSQSGVPVSWIACDDAWVFADLASWPVHPASPEQTAYRWFHERSYARARALGADVLLAGFGGDQLYVDGRRWFWTLLRAEGPGRAIDRLRESADHDGWYRVIRSELVGALLPKRRRLRRPLAPWLTPTTRKALEEREPWPQDVASARRPRQAQRVLALLDANGAHLESWYAERHGLELAMPLRDFELAQFLLAAPDHLLRQGTETRPVLRAATRGLIPEPVRRRPGKASFYGVLLRGLERDKIAWAPALLRSPDALWREHVEADAVERWLAGDLSDDWDRIGLLQCLFAELWRFKRTGGELGSLVQPS